MAYATPADIEARLGRELDASESQIVSVRLEDAEILIKARIPDLDDKILAGTILEPLVVMVESDIVLRLIRNPEGYTQETDGNYSYSIDARVASGRLALLAEEWSLLGIRRSIVLLSPKINVPGGCCERNPLWSFESGTSQPYCKCGAGYPHDTAVWG